MNERIKELAFKAGFVGESMNPIFGTCQETALENFAELIVRECMSVARQQRNPANLNYKPSERFVEDLRQHFGVEE